jgi:enoyl-CoA hydratase
MFVILQHDNRHLETCGSESAPSLHLTEECPMSEPAAAGRVSSERLDRILKIVIDNPATRNAFSPEMLLQLSDAPTTLDRDESLSVGVVCTAGEHFTAGLDMPKFFGTQATAKPHPDGNFDPFGLSRGCSRPVITAVQGITNTVGIGMMLAADILVAADDSRCCQMESKRGIAPLGGAHFRYLSRTGWGNAMYRLMLCDEFPEAEARRIGLVQEVVPAGREIERALEFAGTVAKSAPLDSPLIKEAGRKLVEAGEAAAITVVPQIRERVLDTADAAEGIRSFVERRTVVFEGRCCGPAAMPMPTRSLQ